MHPRSIPAPARRPRRTALVGGAFDTLMAERSGRLWVKESAPVDADPSPWLVFGSDGEALARVEIPAGGRLLHVDATHVVGVSRDSYDVPHVQAWRIDKRE